MPTTATPPSIPIAPAASVTTNRFFDIPGDVSLQLAPWELKQANKPTNVAWFQLREPIRFRSDIAGGVIVVPADYPSDLASIPQFAWSIFMAPDDPRIELGGWVHDLLYQNYGKVTLEDGTTTTLTRKQADQILTREAMPELGATATQCWTVYQALRRFGKGWPSDSFFERFS